MSSADSHRGHRPQPQPGHDHGCHGPAEQGGDRPDDQAATWDERYRESGAAMWSGAPNGTVEVELGDVRPGRAIDLACGEGADAIWLSRRGWDVTGVDISRVAIERARAAEAGKGPGAGVVRDDEHGTGPRAVTWVAADVLTDPPARRSFDLVLMMYPAFRHPVQPDSVRRLADALVPGGTLLAVHHFIDPATAGEHRFDPAEYASIAEIARWVSADPDFTIEVHQIRPRPNPPAGAHHADDEVLRITRTGL